MIGGDRLTLACAMQGGTAAVEDGRMTSIDAEADLVICSVCGLPLAGDPDDEPDHPNGPLCGSCGRAREFDQTLWEVAWHEDQSPW